MPIECCGEYGCCSRIPYASIATLALGTAGAIYWGQQISSAVDNTKDIEALDQLGKNLDHV